MSDVSQMTDSELRTECSNRSWIAGEYVGEPSFNFHHNLYTDARDELLRRHRAENARKHDKEQRERYGDHAVDCALQAVAEKETA